MKLMYSILSSLLLLACFPAATYAQALTVIGGNDKAQECFDNAELASKNLPGVSRSLQAPCDFALDFATISLADRAATYANRGIILAANKEIALAMSDYQKAVVLRPASPEIYVNRGNAYFLNRDYVMAMEDYEQSVALGIRQLHFVQYNMGMTHEKLGNDEAAEKQFRLALEQEPGWQLVEDRLARLLTRRAEDNAAGELDAQKQ